jgi:hypothetical protein
MPKLSEMDMMGLQRYLNSVVNDDSYALLVRSKFLFIVTSYNKTIYFVVAGRLVKTDNVIAYV